MDYLAKEQKASGLTAEQLQAVGCTEPGFKELSMIRVAKYLTNIPSILADCRMPLVWCVPGSWAFMPRKTGKH